MKRPTPGSTLFQEPEELRTTENSKLAEAISQLKSQQQRWATQDLSYMEDLLTRTLEAMSALREEWLALSTRKKGAEGNPVLVSEELFVFGAIGGYLHDLRASISSIRKTGNAPQYKTISWGNLPGKRVKPNGFLDYLLLPGISVDVLFEPGTSDTEISQHQAMSYREPDGEGACCLVLAAGNVGHLLAVDVLTKLFVDRKVVLCKFNPINDYLGPLYERGFAPLIEEGILRFAFGGRATGKFLTSHADIDEIHMTGSKATYEAIVFGTDSDALKRMEENKPLNEKPVSAELGNISPVIVVPGEWSDKMLRNQAQQLAGWTMVVAGYGCLTPRVILTHKEWPLRERFLEELDKALREEPPKYLYYPGTQERIARLEEVSGDRFVRIDDPKTGKLNCAHIFGLDPSTDDAVFFQQENFSPVLLEIPVSADSVEAFFENATATANEQLWGTLNAYVMIDPKTEKREKEAFTKMVSGLDYGTILINMYAGFGHILHCAPWGGAPGRKPDQIDSGVGWTNDPNMFGNPHKTVFKSPFKKLYDPLVHTAKNRVPFCQGLCDYQFHPSMWNGLKLFALVGRSM